MFEDASKLVDSCVKLGITANQFLLCYLLYTDEKVDGIYPSKGRPIANLYKYSSNEESKWTREEVEDLVEKGYLTHKTNRQTSSIYPDDLEVQDSFIENVMASQSRFDQLNAIYPFVEEMNGIHFQLKVCDLDKVEERYNKVVRTQSLHSHILDLVRWAKDHGGVNMKLENFVASRGWQTLQERRKNHSTLSYEDQQMG